MSGGRQWAEMDLVFAVSGHRKISEEAVVNEYSHRQAMLLCEHLIREKFLVANELVGAFVGGPKKREEPSSNPSPQKGLPRWYRPRQGAKLNVVDLDGPMESLTPYLGKGALRKGAGRTRQRR